MPEWFEAGGWVMWFEIAIGLVAGAAAVRFALRPDPTQLARIAELRRALAWALVTGVASDVSAVGIHIAGKPEWAHSPDLAVLVLQGVGESMSPAMLGGALLSIVSLLMAAGQGRLRAQGAAP